MSISGNCRTLLSEFTTDEKEELCSFKRLSISVSGNWKLNAASKLEVPIASMSADTAVDSNQFEKGNFHELPKSESVKVGLFICFGSFQLC